MTTTTNTNTTGPAELRAQAAALDSEAAASFDRCDTDGFLTQAAARLTAAKCRAEANLAENDGLARFITLFTTDGAWVPSKLIDTQYGTRWMLLDADGKRTGTFLPFLPKRRQTLAARGYTEGYALWPARIEIGGGAGRGTSALVGARPYPVRTVADHIPPTTVLAADRFAEVTA